MKINIQYVRTSDDLQLQGIEYEPKEKDICVLFIHGMSGNFSENYFGHILGEELVKEGIGFLFSHNRGYGHINDIVTSEFEEKTGYKSKRVGAMYEIFSECIFDIDAWVQKTKELGYKRIIIAGHSLGAPKVIYYLSEKKTNDIAGVILMSPADMVGLIQDQPNFETLYDQAKQNVDHGEPRKLLSTKIWEWYYLSSQTFLSIFEKHGAVDNLPLHEENGDFSQLATIKTAILTIMSENDDVAIKSLEEDVNTIEKKATGTTSFTKKFIQGACHTYDTKEKELAEVIKEWAKGL